jgi:hypothetical protein
MVAQDEKMIGQESREVKRKVIAILKVLSDSPEPVGSRVIARQLRDLGINLTERAVRYHLKLMDEQGLTHCVGRRDGRLITDSGIDELNHTLLSDKVSLMISKIEHLTYHTSFDLKKCVGKVPVNTSLFPAGEFREALEAMKDAFRAGLCVSDLVAVAAEGERLGDTVVPQGKAGFATVCNIVINGALFKAGILMDSKFGGILQIRNHKPLRFVELIEYAGSSLDPCETFMVSKMTSVGEAARKGEGKILASFQEIPTLSKPVAERVVEKLKEAHLGGLVMMGRVSEPVYEIPVGLNRVGIILLSGLNPVAAAVEKDIEVISIAMSGVIDFQELRSFWDL